MTEENKPYQLNILFSPLLEQNKVEEIIEKIRQKITAESGSFSGEKSLLRRRLAYPIKKHSEAFACVFNFLLPSGMVNKIEKYLGSEKNIIRHLVTVRKIPKAKPLKEKIDLKMIDKIEPFKERIITEEEPVKKTLFKKEKVKIEELDKKLSEILNQ